MICAISTFPYHARDRRCRTCVHRVATTVEYRLLLCCCYAPVVALCCRANLSTRVSRQSRRGSNCGFLRAVARHPNWGTTAEVCLTRFTNVTRNENVLQETVCAVASEFRDNIHSRPQPYVGVGGAGELVILHAIVI